MSIFGELWNKISGSAEADQGVSADQPGGEPMKMPQQPEEKELETPETPEM